MSSVPPDAPMLSGCVYRGQDTHVGSTSAHIGAWRDAQGLSWPWPVSVAWKRLAASATARCWASKADCIRDSTSPGCSRLTTSVSIRCWASNIGCSRAASKKDCIRVVISRWNDSSLWPGPLAAESLAPALALPAFDFSATSVTPFVWSVIGRPQPGMFCCRAREPGGCRQPDQNARGRRRLVSYTHLRAHATPEQLVCRLLLEKFIY